MKSLNYNKSHFVEKNDVVTKKKEVVFDNIKILLQKIAQKLLNS
jgi:hypothetical protein